jgi:hypothetical protein
MDGPSRAHAPVSAQAALRGAQTSMRRLNQRFPTQTNQEQIPRAGENPRKPHLTPLFP